MYLPRAQTQTAECSQVRDRDNNNKNSEKARQQCHNAGERVHSKASQGKSSSSSAPKTLIIISKMLDSLM